MGYELDRLMQQYGLSNPTVGTYQGDPANTAERAAFDKYKSDFTGRINITPQYMQDQYQTKKPDYDYLKTNPDVGRDYTTSGSTLSPEGFARQHYLNYGQYEGRTMPMLQGGQYWGNTLQAPVSTPYNVPTATPPKTDFQQKFPDGLPNYGSGLGGPKNDGQGSNFIGGQFDNYNYGANPTLNKALVKAAPQLQQLMPGGFGGGSFNAAYLQLPEPSRKVLDVILARGYADGGYVDGGAQPDMRDELRQKYADIDAMRQKYIGDAQALIAQEQESLKNPDQSEKWLRLAAAFSKPTKTGSFFESLGNATESLAENAAIQRANRTKALELAIKGNQMGLEGAEAGLKSYGDLAELDMKHRNQQMMMDAYLSNDPTMISRVGALTGNPQAVALGGQLQTQRLADRELKEVTLADGSTTYATVGELLGSSVQPGAQMQGGQAPTQLVGGGNNLTQVAQAQGSQAPARLTGYTTKLTPQQEAKKVGLTEKEKADTERQSKFLTDLEVTSKSQALQASEGEQMLGLMQPSGLAAPGFGADIMLGGAKVGAAVTDKLLGIPLSKEFSDLEEAEKISGRLALRQRENFTKDPNMSKDDLKLYLSLPPGINTSYATNKKLVEMSKLQAAKTQTIKKAATDWIAKYGSLSAMKRDPRTGRMVDFYDFKDEIVNKSVFAPVFDKEKEKGITIEFGGQQ